MVGDNGQWDPQIYRDFSDSHPENAAAVAIRTLLPLEHFSSHGIAPERWPVEEVDLPPGVPILHGDDGYKLIDELRKPRIRQMIKRRVARDR